MSQLTLDQRSDIAQYPHPYFQDRCRHHGIPHCCPACLGRFGIPGPSNMGPQTAREYLDDVDDADRFEEEEQPGIEEPQPAFEAPQPAHYHQDPQPIHHRPVLPPTPLPAFSLSASVYPPAPQTPWPTPSPLHRQESSQTMIPRPQPAPLQRPQSAFPPQRQDSMSMEPLRQALPSAPSAHSPLAAPGAGHQPPSRTTYNVYSPVYNSTDSRSYKTKFAPRNNQTLAPRTNITDSSRRNSNMTQRANFGNQISNRQALAAAYGYGASPGGSTRGRASITPGRTQASVFNRPPATHPAQQTPRPPARAQPGQVRLGGGPARPPMQRAASAPAAMRPPMRQAPPGRVSGPPMGRGAAMSGGSRRPAAGPSAGAPRRGGGGMRGGMRGGRRGR